MSRTEFRMAFRSPRPPSAVAMVALATMTLAISNQIHAPALLWATGCAAYTAWQRERVEAWQESPFLLNGGLLLCVLLSTLVFIQGALAMIALAHFAVLAQGLQLLDRRPRRSEFLLVALAVFQVILAANLTDHLAFPLLLVAFTVSVVWTLVVHTLRAEAIEAGEPELAQRAISRGLLRTTAMASLLSVLLATTLFPLLPRVRAGTFISKGIGSPIAMSGFSENVELGDLGRIRLDPEVVLRVEPVEGRLPAPEDRYWRGLAFDRFDGRRWAVTPSGQLSLKGDSEIGIDLGTRRVGVLQRQRITREKLESGVLFSPGLAAVLRGDVGRIQRDRGGSLYGLHSAGDRVDYEVAADVRTPQHLDLRDVPFELPREQGARFLQLPDLDPAIAELGHEVVADAESDLARALALERHLQRSGRYTNDIPDHAREGRSPIEAFLLERTEGHCEYFASGMVVLARSVGIPARLVNGFAGGASNDFGGFLEVTQSDAHTWVELHFAEVGWVRFDPTPADLRLAGAAELRGERWWATLSSAAELWWFRIVDFDRSSQGRALRKAWIAWHRWRSESTAQARTQGSTPTRDEESWSALPGREVWVGAFVVLLGGLALWRHARNRHRDPTPVYYRTALRRLAAHGLQRSPSTTARAFAEEAASTLDAAAARAFTAITEAYLRERFAGEPAPDLREELRALQA